MKKRILLICAFFILCAVLFSACGDDINTTNTDESTTADRGESTTKDDESTSETFETTYQIKWYDDDGKLISTETVGEGKTPAPKTHEKADTTEWDYTFSGWSLTIGGDVLDSIPAATNDASYYAVFTQTKQQYTVTFDSDGGGTYESLTLPYGSEISKPTNPKKDGYRFTDWTFDDNGENAVEWPFTLVENTTVYANYNEQVDLKSLLAELLGGYKLDPYSYIPESMQPCYEENLISTSEASLDYGNFVSVSQIPTTGFGEQWHMITENLQQSETFFKALSVVETVSAGSIATFNNYFDQNPGDTAHTNFENGIYSVTIDCDGSTIYFVLDYTANLPIFGEQTIQICMSMDCTSKEKEVRIQIGDANALHYTISEDAYTFAIRYAGVRSAYFTVERDENGTVTGHINEYLTISKVSIHSAADFIITEDYVSCVGNKASGIPGFTGYINEVYDTESGILLGYEVRETMTKVVDITFNTLWFSLNDQNGITNIKYAKADIADETNSFFINNSTDVWESKTVGGFSTKSFSRRFDIEMRTRYFYSYDSQTEEYTEHAISVPMLFIQEEYYDTFTEDVNDTNGVNVSITLPQKDLNKIKADYDTLVDIFIENKENITEDVIDTVIGSKKTFSE